jgi:hypothetical protein
MVKGKYRDLADIVRISAEAEEGGKISLTHLAATGEISEDRGPS